MKNDKLVTNDLKDLRQLVKIGANRRDHISVRMLETTIAYALHQTTEEMGKSDVDFTREAIDEILANEKYNIKADRERVDAALDNMLKRRTLSSFGVNPIRYKLAPEYAMFIQSDSAKNSRSVLDDFLPGSGLSEEHATKLSNIKAEITTVFETRGNGGLSVSEMNNLINRELFPDLTVEDLREAMDYLVGAGTLTTQRIRNETIYNPSKRLVQAVDENRIRARKFAIEKQYEHSPLGIISKADTLEQAIWKTMSDYKPRRITDVAAILQAFGFNPSEVKRFLYRSANRGPNRYLAEFLNGSHTLQLSREYDYPATPHPSQSIEMETIVETQPLAQAPENPSVTAPPLPQYNPDDALVINVWKIMSDYKWYKISEVHELLLAISPEYKSFSARSTKLKGDGWFDVMPAAVVRPDEKHGPKAECIRLKKETLCPVTLGDRVIWRQSEIAEYVHRTPGLLLDEPTQQKEEEVQDKVEDQNLDSIYHDIWVFLSRKTSVTPHDDLVQHLGEVSQYTTGIIEQAIKNIIADRWLIIKPNVKFKDNPFYTLKLSVMQPITAADGVVTWKQEELKNLNPAVNTMRIVPGNQPCVPLKVDMSDIAKVDLKTPAPVIGPRIADKEYTNVMLSSPLLTAKVIIQLKGVDVTLDEAKRIVGFYQKHPDRLIIGTGDGLIGDDTVKIKGVELTQDELNEVFEKLSSFVKVFGIQ